MSYGESCNGCVLYKGEATGMLTEDNARVILE
jgi:hypothetical protein